MKKKLLVVVILFLTTGLCLGYSQTVRRIEDSKPLGKVKELEARVSFGAGRVEIASGDAKKAYEIDLEYGKAYFTHQLDYRARGTRGTLDLRIKGKRGRWFKSKWEKNWLSVKLNPTVPIELDMNMGACKANLDLTDLRITNLDLSTGASEIDVYFDKPNKEVMREMKIEAGVGELKVKNLGNANCRSIIFEGGIGNYELDFSGEWQNDCEAEIEIGLGDLTIEIPRNIGVKFIASKNFLTSLHIVGLVKEGDDTYYSEGYDKAKYRLILDIEAGLGSINIEMID